METESDGSRQFQENRAQLMKEKRRELMAQISKSESEFRDFLELTMKLFINPLKKNAESMTPMVTTAVAQKIASNFERLSATHSE